MTALDALVSTFTLALPAVFFIVDPIGVVPVFVAMTGRDTPEKCRAMARRACLTAAGVLVFFALGGGLIFRVFGVTLPAFRVAGGLLLPVSRTSARGSQAGRPDVSKRRARPRTSTAGTGPKSPTMGAAMSRT